MALNITATLPTFTATAMGSQRNPQFGFMYTQGLDGSGNPVTATPNLVANTSLGAILTLTATGTGSNNSPDQTNTYQRGVNLFLNVSNVSATTTIRLNVQSKDNVSGNYLTIYSASLDGIAIGSNPIMQSQVYPAVTSVAQTNMFLDNADLGLTWRAQASITSIASTSSGNAPNISLTIGAVQLV